MSLTHSVFMRGLRLINLQHKESNSYVVFAIRGYISKCSTRVHYKTTDRLHLNTSMYNLLGALRTFG